MFLISANHDILVEGKASGPNFATHTILIRHLYLSLCVVRCGYKNGHRNDTCSKRLDHVVE